MTKAALLGALLLPLPLFAQLNESFSDGNFTAAPAWTGYLSSWTVNPSGQLQSTDTITGSTFYLATPNSLATATEWEWYTRLAFNTSSQNYVDVYLTATESDLASTTNRGYFVRIGGTPDEVSLYRRSGTTSTRIIDGADGSTDHSNTVLKIKVVRNAAGQFLLFRDEGARDNWIAEGSVTDNTFTTSACFGILVKQSTPSFFGKHYFDDIIIRPYTPDTAPPTIRSLKATTATTLDLLFSEPVDAVSSTAVSNYSVSNSIGSPLTATRDAANSALLHLSFNTAFASGVAHTLTVKGVKDLAGNALVSEAATFSHYTPAPNDVVVNEVLFHPRTGGDDYVELYNRSDKLVDLSTLYLANRSSSGAVAAIKKLSDTARYLRPGGYVAITKNAPGLAQFYFVQDPSAVHSIGSLPSYPNEKGTVVVVDSSRVVIDEVAYHEDWHFALLANRDGVALERSDPEGPSGEKSNWHSAATSAGYGTPGYKNSQAAGDEGGNAALDITPKVFSPDGDGYDDVATITYRTAESGYVANVTLFDAGGRPVRYLVRNGLMGAQGSWTWDGLGEQRERLPAGTYILFAECFNLQGKKLVFKKTVTLARKRD
ncbi:MAG TPA: lamin tail domain-containing protein [Chitinophagaceae bacterium]